MRARLAPLALAVLLAPAARAEIALLANGMTLKIEAQRVEGETVFLTLKGGGEVGTPLSQLAGVVPDEVLEEVVQAIEAQRALGGDGDLAALASRIARKHGLDPALVLAVAGVESAFQPRAVSPKGAQGLMQLMPGTARELGVVDAFDPAQNLDGGVRYLRALLERYSGDLRLALAAYNAGAGAVKKHGGVPPYRETRSYVEKVMKRYDSQREAPGGLGAQPEAP
jgi:soluble lytic murein transglycosylase-like protein